MEIIKWQKGEYPFKPITAVQNYFLGRKDFEGPIGKSKEKGSRDYGKMRFYSEKEAYAQSRALV